MLPKIDVPVYETKLISNGEVVKFRPFLVKEQKLFLMAAQGNDQKEIMNVVKQVLRNCILTEIDVNKLPTFDIEHLFLQLRARSVGEVVNLKYNCNNEVTDEKGEVKKCKGVVEFDLNILEIDPVLDKKHDKKIKLTDKLGLLMRYPTIGMVDNFDLNKDEVETSLELIANCIEAVYDTDQIYYTKDSTKKEIMEFIESMQQNDLEKVQQFFLTAPKIKKELDFKCGKCGYHEQITVEGIQNFFG